MPRVSIPVDERLKAEVAESPDVFGLDESLSETRRLAYLLEAGAEALRAQVYDARRRDLYAELVGTGVPRVGRAVVQGRPRARHPLSGVFRGSVVDIADPPAGVVVALVVTNDIWNETAPFVSVVPLIDPFAASSALQPIMPIAGRDLQADPPRLAHIDKKPLGVVAVAGDDELAAIAGGLAEILDLDRLLADPPRATRPQAGALDYPRFGEIHYLAGERYGGERKRYVVVSNDLWNGIAEPTVIVVRTTTSPRRSGVEFPPIQDGDARACCVEARAVPKAALELSPRIRPTPARLNLRDMAAVARGIATALELR